MDENIEMIAIPDAIAFPEENQLDPQRMFNDLDNNGFNLLMRSAEFGCSDIVTACLNFGFDVNSNFGNHTAASLAYANRHYDILLILLNANSKFPLNFDAKSTEHSGLIEFEQRMNDFHIHMFGEEIEVLQNLIGDHRNLIYFFRNRGRSAAFEAISNELFASYEILVINRIFLAPDESFDEAIRQLSSGQKELIRRIHNKHSVAMPNNHLMIIKGSLFVGHDLAESERQGRIEIAEAAVDFLNEIRQIQPMLKLIARAGGFKIILDFNREHVQFINPTAGIGARGNFCTTRHIYIAARNLLNEQQKLNVYGTISHEICHFAMILVYDNVGKPFRNIDERTIGNHYHHITQNFKRLTGIEEIVDLVWNYPQNRQFAELIVRVPQMLANYAENQTILQERRTQYEPLFIDYESRILPEIENKISSIDAEFTQKLEQLSDETSKKVSKWNKIGIISTIFITIAIILGFAFYLYDPNKDLNFFGISSEDRDKIMNGNILFDGINLKFEDFFQISNYELMGSLTSDHLQMLIRGDVLDINDQKNEFLQQHISFNYSKDLSEKLKSKILNGHVNFQGKNLNLKELVNNDENSAILFALTPKQIREILNQNNSLPIGKVQATKTYFYNERSFVEYDTNMSINFDQICTEAERTKMILLSSSAGMGKSTTFQHLVRQLKEFNPSFWISYVDLKQHLKIYNKYERNFTENQALIVLSEILSINDDLEIKVFSTLFNSNKVILLFDGFDEIAPRFKDFLISLMKNVKVSTRNQQWIATRSLFTQVLMNQFNVAAFELAPFDDAQKKEFVKNMLLNIGIDEEEHVNKIYSFAQAKNIDSPLMMSLIFKLYLKNETALEDSNLYALYEQLIEMKIEITTSKGEIVYKDRDNRKASLTIFQVHQVYALKLLHSVNNDTTININEFLLLKKWTKKQKSYWTPEQISRYGFLNVENWNAENEFPDFVHRSFAEFFVAQFITQNLFKLDEDDDNDDISDREIELRTKLLAQLANDETNIEWMFIASYMENYKHKKLNQKLLTYVRSHKDLFENDILNKFFNISESSN